MRLFGGVIGGIVAVAAAAWIAAGCGSSSSNSDGQNGSSGQTTPPPQDSGANLPHRPIGDGPIACGSATCNGASSQVCCAGLEGSTEKQTCGTTCPPSSIPLGCDGPEDCHANACCGSSALGWGCANGATCSASEVALCHTSKDCPKDAPCCQPFSVSGQIVSGCVAAATGTCP